MNANIRRQLPKAALFRAELGRQFYFAKFRLANAVRWQFGWLAITHRAPWIEASARALHPDLFDAIPMTLRDWFAGQALAGMLAMPSDPDSGNFHNNCGERFKGPAEYAYQMADAMLAARKA
ncbi:hypothetical protein [Mesorhizobium sp.]|uniref:hypothetical protein n=1 Tax=Mesorhizobium sp. TaxID=1871066 RepID=UPI001206BD44|nr:hypothetical protein [Mesorhizobium sp.]TIN83069.1 MAG: hypothetical protein E5X97_27435 [Mesorhizobium sp.]